MSLLMQPCGALSCSKSARTAKLAFKPASPAAVRPSNLVLLQKHQSQRSVAVFAKGKAKGGSEDKGGKGKAATATAGGDSDQVIKETTKDAEGRMQKCIQAVADSLNTIRTGRANPAILDKIMVDYFGVPTPLKQMGSVTVPEAMTLLITPFDKSSLKAIEKAILESDLSINPNNDGDRIRLVMPMLTQERRKELIKQAGKFGEDGKVAVRNVRKDVMKKVDKVDLPKDDKKFLEEQIQKVTDGMVKKIDEMVKTKSDELSKV